MPPFRLFWTCAEQDPLTFRVICLRKGLIYSTKAFKWALVEPSWTSLIFDPMGGGVTNFRRPWGGGQTPTEVLKFHQRIWRACTKYFFGHPNDAQVSRNPSYVYYCIWSPKHFFHFIPLERARTGVWKLFKILFSVQQRHDFEAKSISDHMWLISSLRAK